MYYPYMYKPIMSFICIGWGTPYTKHFQHLIVGFSIYIGLCSMLLSNAPVS